MTNLCWFYKARSIIIPDFGICAFTFASHVLESDASIWKEVIRAHKAFNYL